MIPTLTATYFIRQVPTDGHSPLLISADDQENYYVKYLNSIKIEEFALLVYEMIAVKLLKELNLPCAEQALIHIPPSLIPKEVSYSRKWKSDAIAWGSKEIENAVLVSELNSFRNKNIFNQIQNPHDIIRIALFDLWVDNNDRKQTNYNLIIKQNNSRIKFVPIDHGAIFGGFNGISVFNETNICSANNKLISSDLFRDIVSRIPLEKQLQVSKEFLNLLSQIQIKEVLNDVFQNIPASWKINETLKDRIEKFLLSDLRKHSMSNIINSKLPLKPKK